MLETIVLVVRILTAQGGESFPGKQFQTVDECMDAGRQWAQYMNTIDPAHYRFGYAVCIDMRKML